MLVMRPAVLALCALALVAAGCKGGQGTPGPSARAKHDVERTMKVYLGALGTGDGEKACQQLTSLAQRQVVTELSAQISEPGAASCAKVLESVAGKLGADGGARIDDYPIEVRVHGDTATAGVDRYERFRAHLNKTGGRWLISKFPSP